MKNIKICVLVKNHTKNSAHGGSNLRKMTFSKSIFSGIYSMRLDLIIYNEFMGHCLKALQANFIYLLPFRIYWVSILVKILIYPNFDQFQATLTQEWKAVRAKFLYHWTDKLAVCPKLSKAFRPRNSKRHNGLLNLAKIRFLDKNINIFFKFGCLFPNNEKWEGHSFGIIRETN